MLTRERMHSAWLQVVQTVLTQQTLISNEEQAHMLFRFIAPLVEVSIVANILHMPAVPRTMCSNDIHSSSAVYMATLFAP